MDEEYTIVRDEHPERAAWGIIGRGLDEFNIQQAGDYNSQRICFVVQTPDQTIAGGIVAATYWDWLYIDLMWLQADIRGRGYGHRLLTLAEDEGRRRGARQAYLDTFTFQAPDFYQQHGYQIFGVLQDFPAGHQRCFMTKQL